MIDVRERIYKIIEIADKDDKISYIYDVFMLTCIILSIIPMCFKNTNKVFVLIDYLTTTVFIFDYTLRWITADFKLKKSHYSFILYPFTFMALVDLFAILPSLNIISRSFKTLKMLRLSKMIRVVRVFKSFRYSKNIQIIKNVFIKQKDALTVVCALAFSYIFITALIMFNLEPNTFKTFFDALYWATISLTTVGYGDIYAISNIGKFITMISSLIGIAIVALPAGIITAGYLEEIKKD